MTTKQTRSEVKDNLAKQVDGLVNQLADLTDEARASELFKSWLAVQSKFHKYSFCNTMLILSQKPGATQVAGAATWKSMGRYICKGEKAIWINAPRQGKKTEKDEETGHETVVTFMYFVPVPVFDVSQTKGEALPDLEYRSTSDSCDLIPVLEQFIQDRGIKLEYLPTADSRLRGAKGVSCCGTILVDNGLDAVAKASTLVHEIAHELLHWQDGKVVAPNHSRSQGEIEAESVAFVTLSAMGFDVEGSKFYLAAWDGDKDKVKSSLTVISKTAKTLIEYLSASQSVQQQAA